MKNILKTLVFSSAILVAINSCTTDDLEPTLAQAKSVEGSITNVSNLYGLLKGAMNSLSFNSYYGTSLIATNEVRSDNMFSNGTSGRYIVEANFEYNRNSGFWWAAAYEVIATANIIINTDVASLEGDADYGATLQGQAKILRALAHFDLVKNYGQHTTGTGNLGVPIVTEFKGEDLFPARNTVEEVYAAVVADLQSAFAMIDDAYVTGATFPTKYTAKALEARVHLYFGEFSDALSASKTVIDNGGYSIIPADNFVSSWVANNNSMFEIDYSSTDTQGLSYIMRTDNGVGVYGDVQARATILDIYDAEDVRLGVIGYEGTRLRNLGKYPILNGFDNIPIIRYEEVVLTYAEALLETGDAATALTYLNSITSNRNAQPYETATKANILLERQREFAFEGIRWDDMMRTGMDAEAYSQDEVLVNTLTYPNVKFAFPIPVTEMDANGNMIQNESY